MRQLQRQFNYFVVIELGSDLPLCMAWPECVQMSHDRIGWPECAGRYHQLKHDPTLLEHKDVLPPPVAADLNGDGRVEVITATHDARLHVRWHNINLPPIGGTGRCMTPYRMATKQA